MALDFEQIATIIGDDGYNYYKGYNTNDIYYTKGGPDRIKDYWGNDTYLYNPGDGWDEITDSNGYDIIKLGEGLNKDNISFEQRNTSLVIWGNGQEDKIDVIDWFSKDKYKIEKLEFSDGSYYTSADIESVLAGGIEDPEPPPEEPPPEEPPTDPPPEEPPPEEPPPEEPPTDPPIEATVIGTDGYNSFKGYNGNDVYWAKKSNDTIKEYWGNDTYLFYKGDGRDTITDKAGNDKILFGEDIGINDIQLSRVLGASLKFGMPEVNDGLTVIDWFNSPTKHQIEKLQFSDGSYITNSEINHIIQEMAGYSTDYSISFENLDFSRNGDELSMMIVNT